MPGRDPILQQSEDLEDQQIIRSPELGQGGLELPCVKGPELAEQVVDLIADCDFGKHSNRLGLLEA